MAPLGAGCDLGPGVPCLPSWNRGSAMSGSICGSGTSEGTQEVDAHPKPSVAWLLCQAGRWTPLCASFLKQHLPQGPLEAVRAHSVLTPQEPLPRVPSLTGEDGHAEGKSLARGHRSTEWGQVSAHASWPRTPRTPPSPRHTGGTPGSRGGGGRQHAGGLLELEAPANQPAPRPSHTLQKPLPEASGSPWFPEPGNSGTFSGFSPSETTRSRAVTLGSFLVCHPGNLETSQNLRCPLIIHVLLRKSSLGGHVGSTIRSFETHRD